MKNVEELISQIDDFNQLTEQVNAFLAPAKFPINYKGYSDTLYDFYELQDYDILSIFEVNKACLFWSNFFSESASILLFMQEHHMMNHDWMRATEDLKNPSYQYEQACLDEINKSNLINRLIEMVHIHIDVFDKAAEQCLKLYNRALETLDNYPSY